MRLACPKCDARYEVPEDAIPREGRDVKCSNCGEEWFQPHASTQASEVEAHDTSTTSAPAAAVPREAEFSAPEALAASPAMAAAFSSPPEAAPDLNEAPVTQPDEVSLSSTAESAAPAPDMIDADFEATLAAALADEAEDAAVAGLAADDLDMGELDAPATALPKRELEDSVRSILREEAQLEAEARRMEAQRLANRKAAAEAEMQVQPDLGLETAPAVSSLTATQRRLALLRGEDPESPAPESPTEEPRLPARRDLLPDVEEITSTLQPSELENGADTGPVPPLPLTRSGGFRTGFLISVVLLGAATLVYAGADRLSAAYPPAKAPLDRYVEAVDHARIWVNTSLDQLTHKMKGQ